VQRCKILLFALLAIVICAGCRFEQEGTGPGKRPQVLALRPRDELEIGRQAFGEVLKQERVVREGAQVEKVRRVSERIAKAIAIKPLQREINLRVADYQFEWEYAVIQDDRVNAFCLPGGKIVVFSGLIDFVRNDDQLATVIAHEVSHAIAHHASERIATDQLIRNPLKRLAYNRDQESEADHIGLFLMTFAGYDPDEALAFWELMGTASQHGIRLPEFLSDHPNDARRYANMQAWVRDAKAGKAAFEAGRIAKP
jgi:predicted Zn-dependent protease